MRVLLVENRNTLAETLAAGLRADGFAVDVAGDGVGALERVQARGYEAIVLDIMLPGPSGYEVVRRLRGAGVWTPVLMLTAEDGEYDEADALDLGADDYLTKPFSYVVVLAHLRAVIRRGAPERPVPLSAGDLVLDPATRTGRRAATTIDLTPREFSVLEFLMRRRDQVVSKTEIMANVWDASTTVTPMVEVYVGYLRRKIDAPSVGVASRPSAAPAIGFATRAARPVRS